MSATLRLAQQLSSLPSVTPFDAGCIELIVARLQPLGFACEVIESGPQDFRVRNLWAKRHQPSVRWSSRATRTIAFAGHTDVVPTGPLTQWHSDPFTPTHRDGRLFGRGASDMKTSLAAMVVATEEFLAALDENLAAELA